MTKLTLGEKIMNYRNIKQMLEVTVPTKKPRTTIYIDPELFQALEERAKEEKRTISNLCNLIIEQEMEGWLKNKSTQVKK